jgi:murein L,D-transpeptidase YafK
MALSGSSNRNTGQDSGVTAIVGRLSLLLVVLCLAATGASARGKSKFDAIDSCLKTGSAWNYRTSICEQADPGPVDLIRVYKRNHWMAVYRNGQIVREFFVSLGRGGLGPKRRQGDGRVPEGVYPITRHNPYSGYHRSLRIGYPTVEQVTAAQEAGFSAGGDIMIHGLPNGDGWIGSRQMRLDWTEGCIAMTNPEIEWLYRAVADGTPIEIYP